MVIKGQVCIVTGSAQGLGKQFAKRLLQAGARVVISDLKEEAGQSTLQEFQQEFGKEQVVFIPCDVTKDEDLEHLLNETEKVFGKPVEIMVNNAGINTNLGWRKCMEVNIMAVMSATEKALKRMENRHGCKIVNVASMAGILSGLGSLDSFSYTVSKHGVVALSRTLAKTRQQHGVDVLCLCPSWADTEIVSSAKAEVKPAISKMVKEAGGLMPVDRVGEAFIKLLHSSNGSVLAVVAGYPFFHIPDLTIARVLGTAAVVKTLKLENLQNWHLGFLMLVPTLLLHIIIVYIFGF